MRDNQEQSFPPGLFSRILKRLGFEKELALVRRHLKFFVSLLIIFFVLSIFAFVGARHILAESSFGLFLSLILSDPGAVIRYWHSFVFAVLESAPGIAIAGLIFSLAFSILFVRFIVFAIDKTTVLMKLISRQKYGNR